MPIYAKNKVSRRGRTQVPSPRVNTQASPNAADHKILRTIPAQEWEQLLEPGATLLDIATQLGVAKTALTAFLAAEYPDLFRKARVAQAHHLASESVDLVDNAARFAEHIATNKLVPSLDQNGDPMLYENGKPKMEVEKGDPQGAMAVLRAAQLRAGNRQWLASRYDRDTYGESTAANGPVNLGNIFNVVLQEVQREKAQPLQVIENKG